MQPRLIARILLDTQAVSIRPERPFTLTSGKLSPVYVDCRRLISFPRERQLLVQALAEKTRHLGPIDAIAGGETAGIPYAAWLADRLDLPMQYVRKKPKGFGRNAQIEGVVAPGSTVLLVEDMATDGTSKVVFVEALRRAQAVVTDCLVVFYYGVFPYAGSALAQMGIRLHSLATWTDILAEAAQDKEAPVLEQVKSFLQDPGSWQEKREAL